jgi:hypothetical protein
MEMNALFRGTPRGIASLIRMENTSAHSVGATGWAASSKETGWRYVDKMQDLPDFAISRGEVVGGIPRRLEPMIELKLGCRVETLKPGRGQR